MPPTDDNINWIYRLDAIVVQVALSVTLMALVFVVPLAVFVQFFLSPESYRATTPLWQQALNVIGVIILFGGALFGSMYAYRVFAKRVSFLLRYPAILLIAFFWYQLDAPSARVVFSPIVNYLRESLPNRDAEPAQPRSVDAPTSAPAAASKPKSRSRTPKPAVVPPADTIPSSPPEPEPLPSEAPEPISEPSPHP